MPRSGKVDTISKRDIGSRKLCQATCVLKKWFRIYKIQNNKTYFFRNFNRLNDQRNKVYILYNKCNTTRFYIYKLKMAKLLKQLTK